MRRFPQTDLVALVWFRGSGGRRNTLPNAGDSLSIFGTLRDMRQVFSRTMWPRTCARFCWRTRELQKYLFLVLFSFPTLIVILLDINCWRRLPPSNEV